MVLEMDSSILWLIMKCLSFWIAWRVLVLTTGKSVSTNPLLYTAREINTGIQNKAMDEDCLKLWTMSYLIWISKDLHVKLMKLMPWNSRESASEILLMQFSRRVLFFPFSFLLARGSLWLWWRNEWVPGSLQRLGEDSKTHPQGLLLIQWWPDQSGEFLQRQHLLLLPAARQKGDRSNSTWTVGSSVKILATLVWLRGWSVSWVYLQGGYQEENGIEQIVEVVMISRPGP